jgi:hypothetical protein
MTPTDDSTAIYILKTIAKARLQPESGELPTNPEARAGLAAAFGDSVSMPASEGELARAALALLAEDPAFADPIRLMASQADASVSRQQYLEPVSIALTTAALLVLQTRVKFKLDHTGKWSVDIDKKSSSDGAVKLLVERLLSLLGK